MNAMEKKFNPRFDPNGNMVLEDKTIHKVKGRVLGYFNVDDGERVDLELREVYFYFWGTDRFFNLAALDATHETKVYLTGTGLEQDKSYPISFENDECNLWFDKEGVTTGNDSIQRRSLGGTLKIRFIEEARRAVEGSFDFTFVQENPNTSFSQEIFMSFTFNVAATEEG
jgi:hypothetical protein